MSYTLRIRKSGKRVYEIRVSRGRDPNTGKQFTPYTMTWEVPETYSAKRAEREAAAIEGKFKADCKAGKVLTKQEQIKQRKEQIEQQKRKELELEQQPTFSQFIDTFLKYRESQGISEDTIYQQRRRFRTIAKQFGDLKMSQITGPMLSKYLLDLQEVQGKKYQTLKTTYFALKVFFEGAVELHIINNSPMEKIKTPKMSKEERMKAKATEDKALDEETVQKVLKCAADDSTFIYTLIVLTLDTGCRRGEIAALKWKNVNLDTGEILIDSNRVYVGNKKTIDTAPKTGHSRTIVLNPQALSALKKWRAEQAKELLKQGKLSEYVFNGKDPTQGISVGTIDAVFRDFANRYHIKNFHPHALRHTMATLSIANGADVVSVSKKLGHANVAMTLNVYSHANMEAQKRANEILADAIYSNISKKEAK